MEWFLFPLSVHCNSNKVFSKQVRALIQLKGEFSVYIYGNESDDIEKR